MHNKELAGKILDFVGGNNNVVELVHCATRLRFTLNDKKKIDVHALENLDGVITTVQSGGQFQVVVGNKVAEIYRELENMLPQDGRKERADPTDDNKGPLLSRLIDIISSIFTPLLGAMAASGIIKGLLAIAFANEWLDKKESSAVILQAASDSLFYFLPVLLAITAARKFKTDIFVAVTVAGALIYPDIVAFFTQHTEVHFFGLPVMMMKYTGTVLPIILAVYVMSLLENLIKNAIHEAVRSVILPFILLLVMVPLTLLTIGPVGVFTSEAIAGVFVKIFSFNPIIASALFAAGWQVFVIFGMHWAFTPVIINEITVLGKSTLKAATVPAVFAQSGAVLAVLLKTKNKKMKTLASGAFVSSIFGITEPAVYGITLKLKKPFICAVLASAVGGGIVGYSGSGAISMGIPSLVTLPIFYGEGFVGLLIGIATSFVLSAVLTYIVGFDDPIETDDIPEKQQSVSTQNSFPKPALIRNVANIATQENIWSPVSGQLVPLESVNDNVFSSGVVGYGIAIEPFSGQIVAPVNGTVVSTFASGHALHLLSDQGAEVLIHIGIDTIKLDGKFFIMHVSSGQHVNKGDLLVECDFNEIRNAGFDTVIPVVITNPEKYQSIEPQQKERTESGALLLSLS
ncbi:MULTISPECIES: beta-glucoside-specific PTS transporter subunit IIABC [Rahnella]|uniref:PTS glucose transporter subunit IIA n=1 Tax=Rahnella victoriana TaxID=1510570 RepID=A0ABS0DU89_9GAMM|nr:MULTISPECIES: beta-glucoside-specific PTS transporter subunit IIABC [Rahnella]MBF7957455.1 PTS glucose transporter subunit IIA [Rahnella victoriana]PBI78137.1 PTS beta-glucoside transporter subunit IIABC [Rahnella victoriana]TDS97912.1 PTS system beta-glucoside-specific IIA component (Glc family) /PTS system beta-glucoside-specific IIB component (Glc family) /PTS system beta-glucoside-specific IIC component (Glc family) /PTS system IIA component (Glc family) /PTS system IIB component (Glc fam